MRARLIRAGDPDHREGVQRRGPVAHTCSSNPASAIAVAIGSL
jgi:hypothetical protein